VTAGRRTYIAQSTVNRAAARTRGGRSRNGCTSRRASSYQPGDCGSGDQLHRLDAHRGHYEADARGLAPKFNADQTQVELTVEIRPVAYGEVQFTGDPIPASKRDELVPIEREGSLDQDILEERRARITVISSSRATGKPTSTSRAEEENTAADGRVQRAARSLFRVAPGGLRSTASTR
jgi:hypothetical protein